jgi:hypothetical protein
MLIKARMGGSLGFMFTEQNAVFSKQNSTLMVSGVLELGLDADALSGRADDVTCTANASRGC